MAKNFGFIRTAAAVNSCKVADVAFNTLLVKTSINDAYRRGISLLVFPELSITGSTCGDLFRQSLLIKEAERCVGEIAGCTEGKDITVVVGTPVAHNGKLYDCAAVVCNGSIKGLVPKLHIGSGQSRWFSSGKDFLYPEETVMLSYAGNECPISPDLLFEMGDAVLAVEVGSDSAAAIPPSAHHALAGAHIIANPAAENETLDSEERRSSLLCEQSYRTLSAYVHASAKGESTQDTVYAGAGSVWELGQKLAECERYSEVNDFITADIDIERIEAMRMTSDTFRSSCDMRHYERIGLDGVAATDFENSFYRYVEPHPFAPLSKIDSVCRETFSIQVEALYGRLSKIGSKAVIGISGGLDSTLALLVVASAFDKLHRSRTDIIGVTMPGFGTTSRTKGNAWKLMEALGITCREVPIGPAVEQHFKDIGHDPMIQDATYENSQARERTQILMDIANQTGGIVVGTGDLSELALGWATYNGDHMSMYGVNAGVPKTLVRSLVKWGAENKFEDVRDILLDIADTPISPELLPASENDEIQQVTEDLVGPYELHDFFIYNFTKYGFSPEKIFFLARKAFVSYDDKTIMKWLQTFLRRFFSQQFKRSCMPDGPQTSDVSLSPRGAWSMPSDAWNTLFIKNIE